YLLDLASRVFDVNSNPASLRALHDCRSPACAAKPEALRQGKRPVMESQRIGDHSRNGGVNITFNFSLTPPLTR
ncbi:MAG: hypothetical protein WDA72_02815, partial [Desulfomonilia bacterium]